MRYQLQLRASSCNMVKTVIFNFRKHPRKQYIYAVTTGDYCGEMLVFAEQRGDSYCFISVPKNENRVVPINKFEFGIKNHVVEPVEKLPGYVYKLLLKQYHHNATTK
jgi:hypothetical protein